MKQGLLFLGGVVCYTIAASGAIRAVDSIRAGGDDPRIVALGFTLAFLFGCLGFLAIRRSTRT